MNSERHSSPWEETAVYDERLDTSIALNVRSTSRAQLKHGTTTLNVSAADKSCEKAGDDGVSFSIRRSCIRRRGNFSINCGRIIDADRVAWYLVPNRSTDQYQLCYAMAPIKNDSYRLTLLVAGEVLAPIVLRSV